MINISNFIIEKLKVNSKSNIYKTSDEYKDDEFKYPIKNKSGKEFQWFTWWKYLMDNGPVSKHDLLMHFGLQPTSYSTQFAKLSKKNIIVPSKGKLEAKEPDEWN